jgi:hypothetical protein
MTETTLPRPAFAFRSPALPGYRFEARPFSMPPTEGYVGIIYRTTDGGKTYQQCGVGAFKNGEWKHHSKKPLEGDCFWTLMVDV